MRCGAHPTTALGWGTSRSWENILVYEAHREDPWRIHLFTFLPEHDDLTWQGQEHAPLSPPVARQVQLVQAPVGGEYTDIPVNDDDHALLAGGLGL